MGDTGESCGAVAAQCTVTFARKKPCHVLLPGRDLAGDVVVADIGTPSSVLDGITVDTWENDPALWRRELPRPASGGNKYSRGHALLVGGYPMTGAARMAARAAARAGAGLTSIAVPDIALPIYAGALTSIMAHPLSRPEDFAQLLGDSRYTALLIGPGAGVNEATRARARAMLRTHRAVLLDADAISIFAGRVDELAAEIHGPCILTPHEGEFARLFGAARRGAAGDGDKLSRARNAARASGAIIVLKGSDTVIAAPDGRAIVNSNAPANLATAGSGDVLSGVILGLLAQGMDGFLAAAAGVWLHGAAAADFGPGLLAEDLADLLPGVLRRLDTKMA
jgi:NAD(P)H-hydrate epimerase